jgi:ATP-dependent exoDNAse (exonuclease V) alpha subunit
MDSDKEKAVTFDPAKMRHFDHGYAVTSHSSQGLTAKRVLVNMDTDVHPGLINSRLAYVSVSRASHDAQIFTNDATTLTASLSHDVGKASAINFATSHNLIENLGLERNSVSTRHPGSSLGLAL